MTNQQPIKETPSEQQRLDQRHGQGASVAQPMNRSSEMSSKKRQGTDNR
jgi:hypothetical protein